MLAGYAPQLDDCLSCSIKLNEAPEPLYFAPNHGGVLCQECRTVTDDTFPMPPGTLDRLRILIEHPIRESLSENGPGEGVLRVVRAHVLAHAPGNSISGGVRISRSRRLA